LTKRVSEWLPEIDTISSLDQVYCPIDVLAAPWRRAGERRIERKNSMLQRLVDRNWQSETDFLRALVQVPSDNPPGDCRPHADRAAALLEGIGFEVERHPVPKALVVQHGMQSVTNLIVRHRFGSGSGPTIALNAHGDVVPPGDGWSVDPFGGVEKDGALYGRGVAVSKSDFATYAFALMALKQSDLSPNGTIELHLTYDEEAGGFLGPKWLLDEGLTKPDYALSAGFSYAIVTAHNGCLHTEITVKGRQAHAAMPETGIDALEASTSVLNALYNERKTLSAKRSETRGIGSAALTVGLISGGINTNVVPDRVVMRVDRRLIPEEQGSEVEANLTALVTKAGLDAGAIEVDCTRIMLAEPLRPIGDIDKMIAPLKAHARQILGVEIETTGVPLYTDARHYTAVGIPTVLYGAGPRSILEANAHSADEHLQLGDLNSATKIVASALADMLAG